MGLPEWTSGWAVGRILGTWGIAAAILVQLGLGLTLLLPALGWWSSRRGGAGAGGWRDWLAGPGKRLRRRVVIPALLVAHFFGLALVMAFPGLKAAIGETLRGLLGGDAAGALLRLAPWALLRLAGSVALAGLALLWAASRRRSTAPPGLARAGGWIAAGALGVALLSAWLAAQTLTAWELEAVQGEIAAATLAAALGLAAAVAMALGLAVLLWKGGAWPGRLAARAGGALLALALLAAAGGEVAREAMRRPWLIGSGRRGALYLDGFTPDEVRRARADGLRTVRPVVDAAGAPSGALVFRAACTPCHSLGELRGALAGLPPAAIAAWLPRLDRLRGRMPPFPGNAEDAAALVQFLAGLDGRLDEQLPPPPRPLVAAGRRVMEYRCLGCHRDVPLRKRVAGWTEPFAFEAIGRLPKLNPGMPAFAGSVEERRALAAWLTALGAGLAD